jgi:hypothetical protein
LKFREIQPFDQHPRLNSQSTHRRPLSDGGDFYRKDVVTFKIICKFARRFRYAIAILAATQYSIVENY